MTPDGRIDPQPVTLDVIPVTMVEDDTRREALAAANGVNLFERRVRWVFAVLGPALLLAFVIACIVRGGR